MIKTKILLNKKMNPILSQKIIIICDYCKKEIETFLYRQIKGEKLYEKDLCRGCKQKEQIKLGIRGKQYINAGIAVIEKMKGKTHIELYGEEKAENMRKINSEKNSGKNNKNYGGVWHSIPPATLYKGKKYEEIYGKEKSDIIKQKLSIKFSGKNNPMYGKPSPTGSDNGWCGWYKEWFFRSLKELSFIIYYIEKYNLKWESGEKKKYRIEYKNNGVDRNYFSDFIINDKYMIEIKPKYLQKTTINEIKKDAAIIFCNKNKLKYKIINPVKKISFLEIKKLVDNNEVKFIDRYKEKYDRYEEKELELKVILHKL